MSKQKVKTFEDARKHTLKKWKRILKKLEILGENKECGFCILSSNLAVELKGSDNKWRRCYYCLVKDKCNEILKDVGLLYEYVGHVNNLICWLDDLKESDLTSLYKQKGGEVQQ